MRTICIIVVEWCSQTRVQRVGCCFTAQLTLLRNSTMSKEHSNMQNRSALGAESVDMRTKLYL